MHKFTTVLAAIALLLSGCALAVGLSKATGTMNVGANPGPARDYPCESINGVQSCYARNPLVATTTTAGVVCSIKSPAATSTLVMDRTGIQFSVSTTTATVLTIAKAANGTATTTILGNQTVIAANAQDSITASTTAAQKIAEADIIAPNQYINFSLQGGNGAASTYSPVGSCQAEFVLF